MLVSKRMKPAIFLEPDETLAAAARKLRKDNIGCLPVCQDGRLLGMITDRDIAMRGVAEGGDANNMRVREAMSVDAICCSKDDSIETAAAVMRDAHVQRLAVVDDDGHLVGVISITDLEGGGSERRPFEVIFYKEILDHVGLPHHSELLRVSVAQGTKHEAVASAIVQFEETKRVANWTAIADGYDVLSIHVHENGESVEALEHTFERDARIRPRARILWEQAGNPERQDAKFGTRRLAKWTTQIGPRNEASQSGDAGRRSVSVAGLNSTAHDKTKTGTQLLCGTATLGNCAGVLLP